ncbi:MAG TPA: M20 family metallo-hydrolase [Chitinophagales bacterium]|nr:M20 family metallo-hydrolase [Chitinophagales bacterium]
MAQVSQADLFNKVLPLLQALIGAPSFSKEEEQAAARIVAFFQQHGIEAHQQGNNVWAQNKYYDTAKPTLLLNSHHDTVKPNSGYTRNPFEATIEDGKLYGLGSNDAGGPLMALLGSFLHFYDRTDLPFNLVYAATAEEEISGKGGIESITDDLGNISAAIVGEPTQMQMAVAERGLMVLDCVAKGVAGHAARNEGVNAIYQAMADMEWFRNYKFEKKSKWLDEVSMNVTVINAGIAHNQVPAECKFVVDIRLNECYTHEDLLAIIRQHVKSEVAPRSTRIKANFIDEQHPLVRVAGKLNIGCFGSSTTSDMALMPWQAVKMGPGDSARSHSADEFIYLSEIQEGISTYINVIEELAVQSTINTI